MKNIINLHTHTEFSNVSCGFKDSTNKLEETLNFAFDSGMKGIGITDHESVTAHIRAFNWWEDKIKSAKTEEEKQRAESFKVVLGNEVYIAREGLDSENHVQGAENFFHFLLLAKNSVGQKQIRELSSRAWERSYMKGVMRRFNYMSDFVDIIKPNQGHVLASTACIANLAGHAFLTMEKEEAQATVSGYINLLVDVFGEGNLYIELSPAMYPEQIAYNKFMYEMYKDSMPFIITNDVHYLRKDDFRTLQILLGEKREPENYYKYAYFMTWEEITENMSYLPIEFLESAADNALNIGKESEFYNLKHEQTIPKVPHTDAAIPEEMLKLTKGYEFVDKFINSSFSADRELASTVLNKYLEKDKEIDTPERREMILNRLNLEWGELWGIGETREDRVSDYLLTMAWIVQKMWDSGTLVGPGRGSAVAFVTNYYLEITDVNPMDYPIEIPHWR